MAFALWRNQTVEMSAENVLKEVGKIEFDYYPLSSYVILQNIMKKYNIDLGDKKFLKYLSTICVTTGKVLYNW